MRLGLWFSNYRWPQDHESLDDTFATIAQRAERAGLSSIWVPDHFLMPPRFGDPDENMLESWSALAFLAGHTNRIKLGTMVTGVSYRYPGLLLKAATTLDVLSHGRAYLVTIANLVFILLSSTHSPAEFQACGWRVPFLLGVVLIGVGLFVQLRLEETLAFELVKRTYRECRLPIPCACFLQRDILCLGANERRVKKDESCWIP